ncbi:hypothetical protein MSHO_48990 [Mycobacterium shottsii]|uniref:Uncharacterized protein n=1 Tax=Mycobacterium shottsii TaxID=133549 RepID=A0A7I7LIH4_9MYCO|nr:hypothetical protein [Mycobacterium shottsii]BBX59554.1 hypothetical protein MSHO_48990 [Mycobacterium shottsii]
MFVSNDFLHDPAPATLRPHRIASDIGRGALGAVEAAAIVRQINELQFAPELPGGAVSIEAINGAVAAFTPQETAFFHRGQDFVYHWALGDRLPADAGLAARHDALLQEIRHDLAGVRDASSQDACETWFMHQVRNAREIGVRWWSCF